MLNNFTIVIHLIRDRSNQAEKFDFKVWALNHKAIDSIRGIIDNLTEKIYRNSICMNRQDWQAEIGEGNFRKKARYKYWYIEFAIY